MITKIGYKMRRENINMKLPLVERLMESRGLTKKMLEMGIEDMYDPFLMNDMSIAIDRIEKAIKNKEKVLIYGDYDAGATRF